MSFLTSRVLRSSSAKPLARAFSSTPATRDVAKLTIVGRLIARPELVQTSTGSEIVKYTVATSSGPRDNQQSSFWNIALFGDESKQRDYILGLQKGTHVYVEGQASMRKYEKDGKPTSSLNLIHSRIDVLKRGAEEE